MAGKRLGIGVVGAGRWANWAHLPGWARDSRCEIVAVCDRELDRAKAAGEKYGARIVTADYTELLERDDGFVVKYMSDGVLAYFRLSPSA